MVSMPVMPAERAELVPAKIANDEESYRGEPTRHESNEQAESPGHRSFRSFFLP
jgi:hypothetical protein